MDNHLPETTLKSIPVPIPTIPSKMSKSKVFRKAGTSSATTTPVTAQSPRVQPQPQRSFDSYSPLYGTPPLQLQIGESNIDPVLLASLVNGLNRFHLQQQKQQQNFQSTCSADGTTVSSPAGTQAQSPLVFNEHVSVSNREQKFIMGAPRRARSAERFDGMRVAPSPSTQSVDLKLSSQVSTSKGANPSKQKILQQHQQQVLHTAAVIDKGGRIGLVAPSPTSSLPLQSHQVRQSASSMAPSPVLSVASTTKAAFIANSSPPNQFNYPVTMTESRFTPSTYQQTVASMGNGVPMQSQNSLPNGSNRYNLGHRGQSLDANNYVTCSSTNAKSISAPKGLRSANSHPAYLRAPENIFCTCNKCQQKKGLDGRGNANNNDQSDAVYMEGQAFLMNDIMNDGMAFCSIM